MITNLFKTAFRYLSRHISFTIINVLGLTAGIAAFLLIALYLQYELSFDKHIPEYNHLYRLTGIQEPSGLDNQHVAITSGGWAPYLNENIPEVKEAFRIMGAASTLQIDDQSFQERVFFAEGKIVSLFGLETNGGISPTGLLGMPNTAMISMAAAERIFKTRDAIGMTFRHNNIPYTITGVYSNDNIRSHILFDVLLSLSTVENDYPYMLHFGNNSLVTYISLKEGASKENVENLINGHYQELIDNEPEGRFLPITFYLQNARDIYLRSNHLKFQIIHNRGSITTVYIFIVIALLILTIACINYINLSTAHSARRSKEVGIRKVLGATRLRLGLQMIGESLLLTAVAILFSLLALELLIPEFNSLLGTELKIQLFNNSLFWMGLPLIWLFVGFFSGIYPGMVLSGFKPAEALKPGSASGRPRAAVLRKVLVILQFAVSTAMIVATIVVMQQLQYMQHKDRGYQRMNTAMIGMGQGIRYDQILDFRNALLGKPQFSHAGIASQYNGVAGKQSTVEIDDSLHTRLMMRFGYVDPDFFPTMNIEVIRGRNFSREAGTDITQAAIINEAAWRALGWEEPLGQRVQNTYHPEYGHFTIIGVVKDYHYYTLHEPIEPAIYLFQPQMMQTLVVRFEHHDPQQALLQLEEEFQNYFPGKLFNARLIDEILSRQTFREKNTMQMFIWFSMLCIIISCMGLFGLTSFMTNQRKKEISIRKVLGGSVSRINLMLMQGFVSLVLTAALIAIPLAWFFMQRWLNNYPYRIQISITQFLLALFLVLSIAVATVLYYSTRAALQNPADCLKYE